MYPPGLKVKRACSLRWSGYSGSDQLPDRNRPSHQYIIAHPSAIYYKEIAGLGAKIVRQLSYLGGAVFLPLGNKRHNYTLKQDVCCSADKQRGQKYSYEPGHDYSPVVRIPPGPQNITGRKEEFANRGRIA